MINSYYSKLSTAQKERVHLKMAFRTRTDIPIIIKVLEDMDPPMDFKDDEIIMYQNTLERIKVNIETYTK